MKGTHLVVATDLSPGAEPAARWAQALSGLTGHPVCAAHVVEISFASWWKSRYEVLANESKMAEAKTRVGAWYEAATGSPPAVIQLQVNDCQPGLEEAVEAVDGALVAMGASSHGAISQAVMGSRVQEMATRPPCPVAIVHPDAPTLREGSHVMVGVDFSEPCRAAIAFATALVAQIRGRLTLVHAVAFPNLPAMPELFEQGSPGVEAAIEAAFEVAAAPCPEAHRAIVHGEPSEALVAYATEHEVDLVVVARTGYRSVVADVIGSVPRGLIAHLPCTTVVVP